jgi:Trp operon repressor
MICGRRTNWTMEIIHINQHRLKVWMRSQKFDPENLNKLIEEMGGSSEHIAYRIELIHKVINKQISDREFGKLLYASIRKELAGE